MTSDLFQSPPCETCGKTDDCQCVFLTATADYRLPPPEKDIHEHFGLSYANYLVLPRSVLQSMPVEWQYQFVALLDVLSATCEEHGVRFDPPGGYEVNALAYYPEWQDSFYDEDEDYYQEEGWTEPPKIDDPFCDYERGRRNVFAP